ncbi:DivIVA domain-containing protein [Planotetraspora sp. A-T 1434]|uniref:DivIVA domain-containing protein n=1 Tax=Planotetraspora sp. A-T 1434 TaxID=2979219 RepID=UPI0021C16E43|nr:DivIVA domain-containing protein [Planotetraspora sp. A-T 1434]MCT9934503.1 DivIVA domain-containing protein [Planotetraspora sp. A-T 1434]
MSTLLTPGDVRNQVFTVVRLREGYDLTEVDGFLGRVESALSRLLRENEELRSRLNTAACAALEALPPPGERAARIVQVAEEAADRILATARTEADTIVARARERAEDLGRGTMERILELQRQAQKTRQEVMERRLQDLQALVADFDSVLRQSFRDNTDQMLRLLDELEDPGQAAQPHPPRPDAARSAGSCDHSVDANAIDVAAG